MQKYMPMLLEKIETGEIDPSFMITHEIPLEEAAARIANVQTQRGRLHQSGA